MMRPKNQVRPPATAMRRGSPRKIKQAAYARSPSSFSHQTLQCCHLSLQMDVTRLNLVCGIRQTRHFVEEKRYIH